MKLRAQTGHSQKNSVRRDVRGLNSLGSASDVLNNAPRESRRKILPCEEYRKRDVQTGLAHFASIMTPRGGTRNLFAEIRGTAAIVNQGLRVERVTMNNLSSVYSKITEETVNIPEEKFSARSRDNVGKFGAFVLGLHLSSSRKWLADGRAESVMLVRPKVSILHLIRFLVSFAYAQHESSASDEPLGCQVRYAAAVRAVSGGTANVEADLLALGDRGS